MTIAGIRSQISINEISGEASVSFWHLLPAHVSRLKRALEKAFPGAKITEQKRGGYSNLIIQGGEVGA